MQKTKYLRISVTEQCNLSCFFCHNEGNVEKRTLLSTDDIVFVCSIAKKLGFVKFKLTGGEPTLREDIYELINKLSQLNLADLSMITNGTTLESHAPSLLNAGLRRLNVTLNTLDEKRHKKINPNNYIPIENIIRGIDAALRVGFTNMKINFIYIDEQSDNDLDELLNFVVQRSLTLVLLPLLPSSHCAVTTDLCALYARMAKYGLSSERNEKDTEGIQKTYLKLKNGTEVLLRKDELASCKPYIFCAECSKKEFCKEGIFPLRLSAYGSLIPCLANNHNQLVLETAIRNRDEDTIIAAIKKIWDWQIDDKD